MLMRRFEFALLLMLFCFFSFGVTAQEQPQGVPNPPHQPQAPSGITEDFPSVDNSMIPAYRDIDTPSQGEVSNQETKSASGPTDTKSFWTSTKEMLATKNAVTVIILIAGGLLFFIFRRFSSRSNRSV